MKTKKIYWHLLNFLKQLPRKLLIPIMPKYIYDTHLHIDNCRCIGYLAKNGKAVIYGKDGNYNWLYFTGQIR